jgi:hypothetical protein
VRGGLDADEGEGGESGAGSVGGAGSTGVGAGSGAGAATGASSGSGASVEVSSFDRLRALARARLARPRCGRSQLLAALPWARARRSGRAPRPSPAGRPGAAASSAAANGSARGGDGGRSPPREPSTITRTAAARTANRPMFPHRTRSIRPGWPSWCRRTTPCLSRAPAFLAPAPGTAPLAKLVASPSCAAYSSRRAHPSGVRSQRSWAGAPTCTERGGRPRPRC